MISESDRDIINNYVPRPTLNESVYCIINNIIDLPVCKQCNANKVTFFYSCRKGYSDFCSLQCSRKHPDSKTKRENTNIKRYGCKNVKQNAAVQEKTKANNIKKYGVSNPTQLQTVKDAISATLTETYADRKSEILALKEQTFLERYGDHPNRTAAIKNQKIIDTQVKYGVDHTTQLQSVVQKIQESKEFLYKEMYSSVIDYIDSLPTPKTRVALAKECNVSLAVISNLVKKYNLPVVDVAYSVSNVEIEVVEFIKSLGIINVVQGNRQILDGKEIDIFLPDYNIGIEVNGIYWHSEEYGKDRSYHVEKTNRCLEKNIQLLHIFDAEWMDKDKQAIWKSMITSRLLLNKKIYARTCTVKEIDAPTARTFCESNHLQGYVNGTIRLGLFDRDLLLLQVIVLGKPRYSTKADYELIRSATVRGITVVGGLSKLLANVKGSIISYADRRYSNGNGYSATGFGKVGITLPNYFYVVNGQLESRIKYQKHKLHRLLETFDQNLTESENMRNNNFYRIWDCGNYVFLKN